MNKVDIFIGARAGSQRVKNKNTRILGGKPLISHTIDTAKKIKNIQNIIVSSNDESVKDIVKSDSDVTFIERPNEISTSVSQDIEYINHIISLTQQDLFIKLAPTSPFRTVDFIESSLKRFLDDKSYDSARAVKLCTEHPGKMWQIDEDDTLHELKTGLSYDSKTSMNAAQYQDLPKVYVQTSSLEIARTESVIKYGTREGKKILPIVCNGQNAFAIDYELDFFIAKEFLKNNIKLS
tara:strand:- start:2665 stop:3375 length:711 start_codon:yes stop_codon:yes gene_type:complete